jgi:hypothetical protein
MQPSGDALVHVAEKSSQWSLLLTVCVPVSME